MADPPDRRTGLEAETIAAHRAYLAALVAWERVVASDPTLSDEVHAAACAKAEADKERRRIAFRDLLDELGYLPRAADVRLPDEETPQTGP